MFQNLSLSVLQALFSVRRRLNGEDGQTLAEYSMLITIIAVATVTLAVIVFRDALIGSFNRAGSCLDGSC